MSVSIEIELTDQGYVRLNNLAERYAKAGGSAAVGHVLALALMTGIEAQERLLDQAAMAVRRGAAQ